MSHFALGVDLASRSWADNGSALIELDREGSRIACVVPGAIAWPTSSPLMPAALADAIDAFARSHDVTAVALDGPAGWRDPETAPELPGVGRRSEHACRTQGKTGVYPKTYPGTQRGWIEHSIAVFAALLERPGVVLAEEKGTEVPPGGYLLAECFPTSSWRSTHWMRIHRSDRLRIGISSALPHRSFSNRQGRQDRQDAGARCSPRRLGVLGVLAVGSPPAW